MLECFYFEICLRDEQIFLFLTTTVFVWSIYLPEFNIYLFRKDQTCETNYPAGSNVYEAHSCYRFG